jgi:hypothetical protein
MSSQSWFANGAVATPLDRSRFARRFPPRISHHAFRAAALLREDAFFRHFLGATLLTHPGQEVVAYLSVRRETYGMSPFCGFIPRFVRRQWPCSNLKLSGAVHARQPNILCASSMVIIRVIGSSDDARKPCPSWKLLAACEIACTMARTPTVSVLFANLVL